MSKYNFFYLFYISRTIIYVKIFYFKKEKGNAIILGSDLCLRFKQKNMSKQNNQEYYVGLNIGTNSIGYAVTDEQYRLNKFKGEPMWGVSLFESAETSERRRMCRSDRRRLDRRQQRVDLLMELFEKEIAAVDADFFNRIDHSYLFPESTSDKVRIFNSFEAQKDYVGKYPTIHHLILDLMNSHEPKDIRLVYLACAWLIVHRGHFLSDVDKRNIESVTDFKVVYQGLVKYITRDQYALPWDENVDLSKLADILKSALNISQKSKALSMLLFGSEKSPASIDERYEFNYDGVIKLLCGGSVALDKLFGKEEYKELETKSLTLGCEDEVLQNIMKDLEDDAELILALKQVYDWAVLVNVLHGKSSISEAKVDAYNQHKYDLTLLKRMIKKYVPDQYDVVFRADNVSCNYVAYIGKNKTANEKSEVKKFGDMEMFSKYILSIVKTFNPDGSDLQSYEDMVARLELNRFLPKQISKNNRVIPYQLYWYELNRILENAKAYLPFLSEQDEKGITVSQKILSIMEFKIPYFVGPLKEKSDPRLNHWMVRKESGKIYPWNFNEKVDLDQSEVNFIDRMIGFCTYVPGEKVLPKQSLLYSAFEVLNEINNIKINGNDISVEVKKGIYKEVFMKRDKVTLKAITKYLETCGCYKAGDLITGVDYTIKSSLKSFRLFDKQLKSGVLSLNDVENIIKYSSCSSDKFRFFAWINRTYPNLSDSDAKYIASLQFKDFGRLSKKFLCGIEGIRKATIDSYTIIRAMWETNCNLMQLLTDRFTFSAHIDKFSKEYCVANQKTLLERLDNMYVSNPVKRQILRTLDVVSDIKKAKKQDPSIIFVGMARGASDDQKNKRTKSRLEQIEDLYSKAPKSDKARIMFLKKQLADMGDMVHNLLQKDKVFLYFLQLGKSVYTGEDIPIEVIISSKDKYNIEHLYPQSFVKDDSVINNLVLCEVEENSKRGNSYPLSPEVQERMSGFWHHLNQLHLMSDEKLKRMLRTTPFTEDEKFEFINRQLVETRQSSKVVVSLLQEMYPNTMIVCIKAGLVSDFRNEFGLLKSRAVNDLHSAKDAYLNLVVGRVWYYKFSRPFYKKEDHNVKVENIFTREVKFEDSVIWNGAESLEAVKSIVKSNRVHMSMYAQCRHSGNKSGLFKQMPISTGSDLIPRKKDLPTDRYGGYHSLTISFFLLVRYKTQKGQDVIFVPVELMYADRFMNDQEFANAYIRNTIAKIVKRPVLEYEVLLNGRRLKINTVFSVNGLRLCLRSKQNLGKSIGFVPFYAFKETYEIEQYIRRLESFSNKAKNNKNLILDKERDKISEDENLALYDCYISKLQDTPYQYRPNNGLNTLISGREVFVNLSLKDQVKALLSIHNLFCRTSTIDLSLIGGSSVAASLAISSSLSNWKQNYDDVRIIDQSASGLFEKVSENLLDYLPA